MKLLFITHHRRSRTFSRSAPWAREMAHLGHQVDLLCIAEHERWRLRESGQDGVRIVETPDLLPGRLRSGWDPWDALRRTTWLRGRAYDLVHAFETRPATIVPALACCSAQRIPLVMDWNDWWGRGGLIADNRPHWYRLLFGWFETYFEEHFRCRAALTTVISHALCARAQKLGVPRDTIHWIPGGVDTVRFRPQERCVHRARFGLPQKGFVLGYSALDVTHDAPLILDAMSHVAGHYPDAVLAIAGNRDRRFNAALDRLGARCCVRHVGILPHDQLPDFLSCANACLLPFSDRVSNIGRWPHKIGEYMAVGRPTISNPTGEILDLFRRERVGLLAPPNAEGMAAAIMELIATPALAHALGERARAVAVEQFAWPVIAAKLAAAYDACFASADRRLPVS